MIYGIGTDIVAVPRLAAVFARHGERCLGKFLASSERAECLACPEPARFLAKRFAAKEALSKALGTGLRAPVHLTAVAVAHDARGKPEFRYATAVEAYMATHGLRAHLSISDERDYAVAFVIVERS